MQVDVTVLIKRLARAKGFPVSGYYYHDFYYSSLSSIFFFDAISPRTSTHPASKNVRSYWPSTLVHIHLPNQQ
jgi:hypothetical protein